jgi:hypothetical protein
VGAATGDEGLPSSAVHVGKGAFKRRSTSPTPDPASNASPALSRTVERSADEELEAKKAARSAAAEENIAKEIKFEMEAAQESVVALLLLRDFVVVPWFCCCCMTLLLFRGFVVVP